MFCRQCGHNLADNQSGHCPKCGRAFDYTRPTTYAATPGAYRAGKIAKKGITAFVILGILTACYVGAYALLVVPQPPIETAGDEPSPMQPAYRSGGDTCIWIFQPIVLVDRWVYPRRWQYWQTPRAANGQFRSGENPDELHRELDRRIRDARDAEEQSNRAAERHH
jgi:hypothetical protein